MPWWGRGAWSCYFGYKSQPMIWRQNRHHLCLHCRFFSHLTSFLGTFCFWCNRNAASSLTSHPSLAHSVSGAIEKWRRSVMLRSRSMSLFDSQSKQVFWSQTCHHLCLQCLCCSHFTSFLGSIRSCVHFAHQTNYLSTLCTCTGSLRDVDPT